MSRRILYAGMAVLALSAASGEVVAQGSWFGALRPYEVVTIVRSTGLNPLDRPFRRGPTYVLHAIDRSGEEVRVVVDARHGDILSVTPVSTISRMGPVPSAEHYGPPPRWRGDAPPLPEYFDTQRLPSGDEPGPRRYGSRLPPPDRSPGMRPPDVIYATPPGELASRDRPVEYHGNRPVQPYGARPVERVPMAPPPGNLSPLYDDPPPVVRGAQPRERQANIAPDREQGGPLPPPPERFQRRPMSPETAMKPAAPIRTVAGPSGPPMPKPRPAAIKSESAKPDLESVAAAPPAPAAAPPAPVQKRADDGIAH